MNGRKSGPVALHQRDFNSQAIACPPDPPGRNVRPVVQRIVRLTTVYTCTQASPNPSVDFTFVNLSDQDGLDYKGVTTSRYQLLRIDWVKAWVGAPRLNVASSSTGVPLGPVEVVLFDTVASGDAAAYSDVMSSGVDWAAVGYKPSISDRMAWEVTSSTNKFASVTVNTPGLGPTDNATGNIVLDVLVSFH